MTVLQRLMPVEATVTSDGSGPSSRALAFLAVGALIVCAVIALLHDTAFAIVQTWWDSTNYNHGFLIIPICLYLAWTRREALAALAPAPDLRGGVLILGAAALWLLGNVSGTMVVQEFALVLLIQAIFFTLYGWAVSRAMVFPLFYLFLAVPVGDALVPDLQRVTAEICVWLLRSIGMSVYTDGTAIATPTGNFVVAEACSGARFLIASLAVGVLFAGLMYRSWIRRALFLIVALAVPILANGVRAFGIIWLAYISNNQLAMGIDHIVYGWVFFTLVTFIVLGLGSLIREPELAFAGGADLHPSRTPANLSRLVLAGLMALALIGATKLYADHVTNAVPGGEIRLAAPAIDSPFRALPNTPDPLAPGFAQPDAELHAAYQAAGRPVYLHIGYYRSNRRGAQAVSSAHKLDAFTGWTPEPPASFRATVGEETIPIQTQRLVRAGHGRVFWYWYWVDGRITGNPYLAKLLDLRGKLLGGTRPAAIIVIGADYDERPADAAAVLTDFAKRLGGLQPVLERALGH